MELKIALVDDEDSFNFYHQILLEEAGFSCPIHSFLNGFELLDFIVSQQVERSLILVFLDINMPKMNAWGVLERLAEMELKLIIHIIMVSSSIDLVDKNRSLTNVFVHEYVEKPVSESFINQLTEKYSSFLVD